MKSSLFAAVLAILVAACSSSDSRSEDGAAPPAPPTELADAGAAPAALPRPAAPQIVSAGGPILAAPKLLVVTFGDEPLAPQLATFAGSIGASSYWRDTTGEYGVGPAAFARMVHLPAAPATTSDEIIEGWLVDQLDGTHPEWGSVDANTIVTLVYPKSTAVTLDGAAPCRRSPAWHGMVVLKNQIALSYAAIARCDPFVGLEGLDFVTAGLSHEWIEASTNPLWSAKPAFNAPGSLDAPWTVTSGGELADMCSNTPTVYFKPDDLPFTVQRSWSNASAAAGHDPCVPRRKEPYFLAVPATLETVRSGGRIDADVVRGVVVRVGESRTIDISLVTDGDTAKPWTVLARDFAQRAGRTADLKFAWDRTTGASGDTLHLTITRIKADADFGGAAIFELLSTLDHRQSVWTVAVGDAASP